MFSTMPSTGTSTFLNMLSPLAGVEQGDVLRGRDDDRAGERHLARHGQLCVAGAERAYRGYAELLNEDAAGTPIDRGRPGLARELARMNLSLNFYTQWYWKIHLHNLLHFLSLRADPHAQYEIRAYAKAMLDTLALWVPMTYAGFLEYRMNAAVISATGLAVIRRLLAREPVDQTSSGLSAREWRELMIVLGRPERPEPIR